MTRETVRRINHLASKLNYTRYLEIGVSTGDTFFDIEIPDKTGVDPTFRFDTSRVQNDRTRLISASTDEFFCARPPSSPPYDLVFIDGLHTFEQVARDFANAAMCTHPGSVIILDDTIPNDVYSSLPNERETARFRKMVGINDAAWHGDVFKFVFFIHDFWRSFEYRTIIGAGNPQTIIWRPATRLRTPRFDRMDIISNLTFFDLHRHIDLFSQADEADSLEACVRAVIKPSS